MQRSQRPAADSVTDTVGRHLAAGRHEEAIACCRAQIDRQPGHTEAWFNLGVALMESGDEAGAVTAYRRAIELNPQLGAAYNNLGVILRHQGAFDEALAWFRKAASLKASAANAYLNMGSVLRAQGKDEEALKAYRKASAAAPADAEIRYRLGECYSHLNRHKEALAAFEQAVKCDPQHPAALFSAGMARLVLGDSSGFALYEHRLLDFDPDGTQPPGAVPIAPSLRSMARWQGQDLAGKRLLVWAEQGIGDSLMMMRYLPQLRQRGLVRLDVYCAPSRMALMATHADRVLSTEKPVDPSHYDYYCPIMSLPYAFGSRLDALEQQGAYLQVTPAQGQQWARKLAPLRGLKVGLVWAGNRDFALDALRSIPLPLLAPLLRVPGVAWVSLQKGDAAAEVLDAPVPMADWAFHCQDFMDTAALVSQLDLVIGVDTAVIHLAGALGKPVWLFNRYSSEWRWMTERADSPWYPTLRQFRQPAQHDWGSPIAQAAQALAELAAGQPAMTEQEWTACIKACNAGPYKKRKKGFFARWFGA